MQLIKGGQMLLNAEADPNFTNNAGMTPVEIAALKGYLQAVMILFPVTKPIPTIPDWSVVGLTEHVHSDEAEEEASYCKKDAAVPSNQSLCWARLNEGGLALEIAQLCSLIRPEWPKAYYRQGAALMLLKDFGNAADAFYKAWKMALDNKDIEHAFRFAYSSNWSAAPDFGLKNVYPDLNALCDEHDETGWDASYCKYGDAAVVSNQSLCWPRLNEGGLALELAELCCCIWPDWPKACYRQGGALIVKRDLPSQTGCKNLHCVRCFHKAIG
ncbi:hypothetical protein SLEP1_g935 [Rubroshorea leprosula]|uniref:Uncharacterized protein n=1 Tax=Rubroshorea leprosula TaxID=152421 RepID=A0AAV5HKH3_9ROSI|nr:hypothetical protein SLEP1_g935 [Rubroshorea leprosula]